VNNLPLRLADEVPLDSASGNCPKPGPQVRQDYGSGAHDGEGDPSREINIFSSLVTVRASPMVLATHFRFFFIVTTGAG
jgi:hypothetical protein